MSLLPKAKQPIQSTSNNTGGMPMKEEHFTRMMNQIQVSKFYNLFNILYIL